jgi:hypothetical protein
VDVGKDERDLEVFIVNLGLFYERHYWDCSKGVACNFIAFHVQLENKIVEVNL